MQSFYLNIEANPLSKGWASFLSVGSPIIFLLKKFSVIDY
jgi:hypothetical protein